MPTQWQDQYTDLSNVNNGNELQNGDDILAEHVNVALENGAYAKKILDNLCIHFVTLTKSNTSGNITTTYRFQFQFTSKTLTPSTSSNIHQYIKGRMVATGFIETYNSSTQTATYKLHGGWISVGEYYSNPVVSYEILKDDGSTETVMNEYISSFSFSDRVSTKLN